MRRADRLFQIVQILRRGRVVTSAQLAQELETSVRTIYRDMDDLTRSGIPVYAEAGVGYRLLDGFDLPPLMFSREELAAIEVGARMLSAWTDGGLAKAIGSVLDKIEQVLPASLAGSRSAIPIFAPRFPLQQTMWAPLADMRGAAEERRKVRIDYADDKDKHSQRIVRPLGLYYWGRVWTLGAWCELREDFRTFRLDRMYKWKVLDQTFKDEPGKTFADYERLTSCESEMR